MENFNTMIIMLLVVFFIFATLVYFLKKNNDFFDGYFHANSRHNFKSDLSMVVYFLSPYNNSALRQCDGLEIHYVKPLFSVTFAGVGLYDPVLFVFKEIDFGVNDFYVIDKKFNAGNFISDSCEVGRFVYSSRINSDKLLNFISALSEIFSSINGVVFRYKNGNFYIVVGKYEIERVGRAAFISKFDSVIKAIDAARV